MQFYPTDGSMVAQQPPVPLNLPAQATGTQADYVVSLSNNQAGNPFDFKITRKSSNKVLYVELTIIPFFIGYQLTDPL